MSKKHIAFYFVLVAIILGQSIYSYSLSQKVSDLSHQIDNIQYNYDVDNLTQRIDSVERDITSIKAHDFDQIEENKSDILSIKLQLSDIIYQLNNLISTLSIYTIR